MRFLLANFICIVLAMNAIANMANPLQEGTSVSNVLSTTKIDITSQIINVTVTPGSYTASFEVLYNIDVPANNKKKIPLLFVTNNLYNYPFKIFVDGKETSTVDFRTVENYKAIINDDFKKFIIGFDSSFRVNDPDNVYGLKYFEIPSVKGHHVIKVEYKAHQWSFKKKGQTEKYFVYEMSPAKQWRSFKDLTINITLAEPASHVLNTNLGDKSSYSQETHTSTWKFDSIPVDRIRIDYYGIDRKIDSSETHWLISYMKNNIWASIGILAFLFFLIRSFLKK